MKYYRFIIIIFLLILFINPCFSQKDPFHLYPDTLNKKRLNTVIISASGAYTLSMVGLYTLWYKNYPHSGFHFINDNKEWKFMDKIGHAYSTYNIGRVGYASLRYSGLSEKKAIWYGGMFGFAYLTVIEILDGFSEEWGASTGDLIANTFGSTLFISQQLLWHEQRINLKYSFHPSKYANYRPDLLGKNFFQQLIKDYNGMTFWASSNIHSFLPQNSNFPKWLNIAFGYGADGMTGALNNSLEYKGNPIPAFERRRQYYLSLDIDLSRIPTKSKFLHFVFNALSLLKFPLPTLELRSDGEFKFHTIYF